MELLDAVADRRGHVVVTRDGRPAAALVSIDEYRAIEDTAELLSDAAALTAIQAGLADLIRGDVVSLNDLDAELAERRQSRLRLVTYRQSSTGR